MLGIYSVRICFASRRGQPRLTNVDSARRGESNDCWYFVDYRKLFRSLMTLPLILKLPVIESLHGIICRITLKTFPFIQSHLLCTLLRKIAEKKVDDHLFLQVEKN